MFLQSLQSAGLIISLAGRLVPFVVSYRRVGGGGGLFDTDTAFSTYCHQFTKSRTGVGGFHALILMTSEGKYHGEIKMFFFVLLPQEATAP